jgi:hypothetical protein
VTRSQITGPQITSSQGIVFQSTSSHMTTRSSSLGNNYLGDGVEEEDSPPRDDTSEKRKPKVSVGNPMKDIRESKPSDRFFIYLSMARNIFEYYPSMF